jgi:menaquinol-cytochrome c reductase iron-sulfur subunit
MSTKGPELPEEHAPVGITMLRRSFLNELIWGLSGIATLAVGIPIVGFLFAPLFRATPRRWRTVGTADAFAVGTTTEVSFLDASPLPWAGVTARTAAWLRRVSETEFIAFSVNCTHLGCPVRWLPDAELFMCPCHGGVYYPDGGVAGGPPPRPLVRYPVRVQNGRVEILTSPIPVA